MTLVNITMCHLVRWTDVTSQDSATSVVGAGIRKDGAGTFLQNAGTHLSNYMALLPRKLESNICYRTRA
jgi:hypothetical protein